MKRLFVVLVAALATAACSEGPEGPGTLEGTIDSGTVLIGAVVVQFSGSGIGAVSGSGSTRAFGEQTPASSKRVVFVSPTGGNLSFRVEVEDRSLPAPTGTVVEAIGPDNEPLADLSDILIRFTN